MLPYLLLVPQLLKALIYADQAHRDRVATDSMLASHELAEELRMLLGAGRWVDFEAAEARAWVKVDGLQSEDMAIAAVQLSLVRCEYGVLRQDPTVAQEGVELVRSNGANLPPEEAREFELQALALATLTLREEEQDPICAAYADRILSREVRARQAHTGGLLVIAASHVALVHRALGQHDLADRAALRAVELSERPDLLDAYAHAGHAALDAAMHCVRTAGASAVEWFDRAEQVLASSEHPLCRLGHAEVLLLRDSHLPGDPLLGGQERSRRNELVLERLEGLADPKARQFAVRACANLASVCRGEGRHTDAVTHLEDALARLAAPVDHGMMRFRIELLLACGRARAAAEDPRALQELELALEEASGAVDPGARALVVAAVSELEPMLSALGMHSRLAEHLHRAGEVVGSLPAETAAIASAELEMVTADAEHSRGRVVDARARLAALLARLEKEPAAGTGKLRFFVVTRLAFEAFSQGEFTRAVEFFERALNTGPSTREPFEAECSEVEWALATSKAQLGLIRESRELHRRAFERGRASGHPLGRLASARSALALGEHALTSRERREWLESALALARGCHMAVADRLAESIQSRLRESEQDG